MHLHSHVYRCIYMCMFLSLAFSFNLMSDSVMIVSLKYLHLFLTHRVVLVRFMISAKQPSNTNERAELSECIQMHWNIQLRIALLVSLFVFDMTRKFFVGCFFFYFAVDKWPLFLFDVLCSLVNDKLYHLRLIIWLTF